MAKYRGVGVNFGVSSSLAAVTGAFQTRDHGYRADNELIRNGSGDAVEKTFYNANEEASFEYVATGASGGAVTVTVPAVGDLMTITDPTYTAIAATNWIVDSVDVKGSNTTATRVTVKLNKYGAITS